jgi:hypothetical protein
MNISDIAQHCLHRKRAYNINIPCHRESIAHHFKSRTFEFPQLDPRICTASNISHPAVQTKIPNIAELDRFSRFQRFLRKPFSFGGAFGLFAVALGIILGANHNKLKRKTERDERWQRREIAMEKVERESDERLLRIEKMVAQPKSTAIVVRADEIREKESILEYLVQERNGW